MEYALSKSLKEVPMRVKALTTLVGLFCLMATACQRPVRSATQKPELTEGQQRLCVSIETDEELEKRFWKRRPRLPKGLSCLQSPVSPELYDISRSFRDPKHSFSPGNHTGTDFHVPAGTRAFAIGPGVVTYARATEHGTNYVIVKMRGGWKYMLLHLSEIRVNKGERVQAGRLLGLSGGAVGAPGSGPCTTGPHLHLGLLKKGKYTNFENYLCAGIGNRP